MAMTPEGKVKKEIKKILDSYGVLYTMPFSAGYSTSGVSDFLCCYKGHFISIEAKAGKGKPTELQTTWINKVQTAGGHAMVVNESRYDDLRFLLDHLRKQDGII